MSQSPLQRLVVGAMSGTSADGVDVALVRIGGRGLGMRAEVLGSVCRAFDAPLRGRIVSLRRAGGGVLREVAAVGRDVAIQYAAAVQKLLDTTGYMAADVAAVAAHGQTLFHDPPLTIQQFDPAVLADRTGIDVVSDFRRADLAAGGQGAPLVPFADYILFRSERETRVVLNLGGIANVTILPGGGGVESVTGFDTGPANCLSDAIVGGVDPGGIDVGGERALHGVVCDDAVETFCAADYVQRRGAKSTDGPAMWELFRKATSGRDLSIEDQLATAAAIVAECVLRQTPANAVLLLAGGGAKNVAIVRRLAAARDLRFTDEFNVAAQDREAIAFALLGAAFLDREPANLPGVTGAMRRVVLGAVWPATTR